MLQVTEETRKRVEIDGLIERWQEHRDQRAFNRLLAMHRHVIAREADRYRWPDVEYEDRLAAAYEGFLLAANKATVGCETATFATYCRKFIRDAIIDAKRRSDAADPTKGRGEDEDEDDPTPSPDELADPAPSPEREASARIDLQALMDRLSEKHLRVVEALHFDELTQAEAAERLGIDERTVRRIAKAVGDRNV